MTTKKRGRPKGSKNKKTTTVTLPDGYEINKEALKTKTTPCYREFLKDLESINNLHIAFYDKYQVLPNQYL